MGHEKSQKFLKSQIEKHQENLTKPVHVATKYLQELKHSSMSSLNDYTVRWQERYKNRLLEIQHKKYDSTWKRTHMPGILYKTTI